MKRSLFCLAALWLAGGSSVSVTALELANASIADINAAFDSGELTSERLVELLSELASGDARSSLGGVTRNPYDPMRSPSGSSQGTAVAVAAGYVPLGLGTDTGGSIRLPTSANGIAGIRPTQGLLSRDGIIPLSSTFDMPGPMARTVEDVASALGVLTGIDAADPATQASEVKFETDYTKYLDADALNGARIGVARQFFGQDGDVDWVLEASIEKMRAAGVTIIDTRLDADPPRDLVGGSASNATMGSTPTTRRGTWSAAARRTRPWARRQPTWPVWPASLTWSSLPVLRLADCRCRSRFSAWLSVSRTCSRSATSSNN